MSGNERYAAGSWINDGGRELGVDSKEVVHLN